MQLSGRAGRNQDQSLCVLYFNPKQKVKDTDLKAYCSVDDQENCRRMQLLRALGDVNIVSCDPTNCCDRCNRRGIPAPHLQAIMKRGKKITKPRTKRRRKDDNDVMQRLRERLIVERDRFVSNTAGLKWLGSDHVCNNKVISGICERAHLIKTVADLSSVSGLWRQLYEPMYNVVADFQDIIPPPAKK